MGCRGGRAPRPLRGARLIFRRSRFGDVIARQLDLFEREHAGLVRDVVAAEEAYDAAPRDEAEESWRIVDPVVDAWARDVVPLSEYPAGSDGPGTIE